MARVILPIAMFLLMTEGLTAGPVPSISSLLGGYQKTVGLNLSGILASSFSGVTLTPAKGTLYIIDDSSEEIYELSKKGELLRIVSLFGFRDTEGIAYHSGNFYFIVEERLANIVRIALPLSGGGPVTKEDGFTFNLSSKNWENTGLEGVAYDSVSQMLFTVKETNPSALFRITLDEGGRPTAFFENDPFSLTNLKGDAAGIYVLSDGSFLILNQMENKLTGYSRSGETLSELPLAMEKPEGITVDESRGTLFVVGEPREFCVFENPDVSVLVFQPAISPVGLSPVNCAFTGKKLIFLFDRSSQDEMFLTLFDCRGRKIEHRTGKTTWIPPALSE